MNTYSSAAYRLLLVVAASFLLVSWGQGDAPQASTDYSEMDSYVLSQMDAWNIPGAALVVIQDGEVMHLRGFGRADSTGREVTAQTPFEIGSCTKSFTALAVLQLVERGRIELDAPVQRYLPWFRVADASAHITIRNLLNHTSGISTGISNRRTMINPRGLTLEEQVRGIRDLALSASPGTLYQYSNLNYMTLALIIETVTGQSYGDYLKEAIFVPLKMETSFADFAEARQHGISDGHTWWFGLPFKSLEGPRPDMLGAGYLMVSAEDMSHYLIAQLNEGVYAAARVLSPQDVSLMHQRTALPGSESEYGMGWVNYEENGLTVITHSGSSAGFTCTMFLVPEKHLGLAVLGNIGFLLQPDSAWSLANQVKDMLLTGQPSTVGRAYRDFFMPWDAGFLLASAALVWSFLDFPRWRRRILANPPQGRGERVRRVTVRLAVDGVLALVLLFGIPFATGFEIWRGMFVWQPDAAYWCLTAALVLLTKLGARITTALQLRGMRSG